ncbi:MAG TPA: Ldh family oxidoreductase, partial [Limnochordia bacterium]|nr:Ldh family oxidoreductase [Limnochordia bacterium]
NSDAVVAPFGARARFFGTNPLAISFPAEDGFVPTLDMATSAAAFGKVLIAQADGRPLPAGWAIDAQGRPTTDPHAATAGALLPFGGPKGSGLAFAIELLCGVLLGGAVSDAIPPLWAAPDRPQGLGHCFLAIDPAALGGEADRPQAISAYARRLMALEPASGAESVLAPGYLEWQREERYRTQGVPIAGETYDALQGALHETGCAPLPTGALVERLNEQPEE